MAQDLIKKNEVVGVPANPVIVANLASLPGGVEVVVSNVPGNYPGGVDENESPKVLKAGHIVYQFGDQWYSSAIEGGEFLNATSEVGRIPGAIGVVTEDAKVFYDDEADMCYATCSVMLMGVVDASQCPAKVGMDAIYTGDAAGDSVYCRYDACHIVFINRPEMVD